MTLWQKRAYLFLATSALSSYVGDLVSVLAAGSDTFDTPFLDNLCLLQQHFRVVPQSTAIGDFGFGALPEEEEEAAQLLRDDQQNTIGDDQFAMQLSMQKRPRFQRADFDNSHKLNSWQRTPLLSRTHAQHTVHHRFTRLAGEHIRISSKVGSSNIRKQQLELMSAYTKLNLQRLKEEPSSDADVRHADPAATVPASPVNSLTHKSQVAAGLIDQTAAHSLTRLIAQTSAHSLAGVADEFDLQSSPQVTNTKVVGGNNTNKSLASKPVEYEFFGSRLSVAQRDLYAMFGFEVALVIFIGLCWCVGAVAANDGQDDSALDEIVSSHVACWACVDVSHCCVGLMGDFHSVCCLLVFLTIINLMWWVICLMGLVEQYATQILLYFFVFVVSLFTSFCLFKCAARRMMESHAGREVTKVKAQVAMISHMFETQYGRKYLQQMEKSKQFSKEQIRKAKKRMKETGSYVRENLDDVTDFLGMTVESSEDDITAKDLCRGFGDCMREGPVDHAEFMRRNNANRTEADKELITTLNLSDVTAQSAAKSASCRTCF